MLQGRDNIRLSVESLRAHKLRSALTIVGLMMGVATLITVMTIVQGANVYVEQKIANLGTNVFQVARMPFTPTDFDLITKALRYRRVERDDYRAVQERCDLCKAVGASATAMMRVRHGETELADVNVHGHTANMAEIDTRTLASGRYFSDTEAARSSRVCLIGATIIERFFTGADPLGQTLRIANQEYTIIGTIEHIGSVLGQDQDNFVIVPLPEFLKLRPRHSLTLNVLAHPGAAPFEAAQEEVTALMRARRHLLPGRENDFFIGTKETYIDLWRSISGAFFAVFIMVSSISAVVGGVVIMNVMLVSVTERTKEIGIRRAVGATKRDVARQFLTESVMQCLIGGFIGIAGGFGIAVALRNLTAFPASVQTWVAALGLVLSSAIGLFFGIYPAMRAANLDPVVALRTE